MKIPETSANVGAYYGNEENGQWQPNGVIIDSGVGGGIVGSGDAGLHRPVYPMHIPRGHVSGYVMAGAYYGAAGGGVGAGAAYAPGAQPDDFADYMWMEHEEEFDKQVMQQLEEEALMEQCIEAMLEDEQRERHRPSGGQNHPTTSNGTSLSLEETVSRSTLNPLAAEFVPTRRPHTTDDKTEPPSSEAPTEPTEEHKTDTDTHAPDDAHTEEPPSPPTQDPPEVSAADIQPDKTRKDSKRQDSKKQDSKKTVKQDSKKKPQITKSDTKVQPKKKEAVKAVKSEGRVSDEAPPPVAVQAPTPAVAPAAIVDPAPVSAPVPVTEVAKPTPAPAEEPPAGPKPINYAAAAKANKPKKAPTIEKTPPPMEKPKLPADKQKPKEKIERPTAVKDKVQRKNSAK